MPKTHYLKDRSIRVKQMTTAHGFEFCGISKAGFLDEEAPRLENWLKQNMHGQMGYMENYFDKRLDPTLLVPGSKSVISLLLNYYTPHKQTDTDSPKISKYAYGEDYHTVIKKRLSLLFDDMRAEFGDITARFFTDSAPVLEKAWAQKSGLGWIGKNANLITKQQGSFFFLAEIITDLELEPDGPIKDFCGSCTRCIDACPTEAISEPYKVDGSKCISYFTIELREDIPQQFAGKLDNWMFGCDICQDVCPWNRFSKQHTIDEFMPRTEILSYSKKDWEEITEEVFSNIFRRSPIKRTKYEGLKRNIRFLENKD